MAHGVWVGGGAGWLRTVLKIRLVFAREWRHDACDLLIFTTEKQR